MPKQNRTLKRLLHRKRRIRLRLASLSFFLSLLLFFAFAWGSLVLADDPGNALNFDGSNDVVDVGNVAALNGVSEYTIEAWVRFDSFGNYETVFAKRTGDSDRAALLQLSGTAGNVAVAVNSGYGVAPTGFSVDTWYHVAVVYDGGQASNADRLKLYVDGAPVTFTSLGVVPTITPSGTSSRLTLGAEYNGTTAIDGGSSIAVPFDGSIDEFRVWNYARSQSEIQADMNGTLTGSESGLEIYYKFDQGTAGGDNSSLTTLTDSAGSADDGTLWNFALTGSSSNWIASTVTLIDQPVAVDDTGTTAEDAPLSIDLLSNDSETGGNPITITTVSQPANGLTTLVSTSTVVYTPGLNFNGSDVFSYSLSNGTLIDTALVTVTVSPVNDDPLAVDDGVSTTVNTAVTINVVANDSDPDGDAITLTTVSQPVNGLATVVSSTTLVYTPTTDFYGQDVFTYSLSDGLLTTTAGVTVTVIGAPHIETLPPGFLLSWGGYGSGDGKFNSPRDIELDRHDQVYVVDRSNHRVQKFTLTGTYVSQWGTQGSGLGQFYYPGGLAVDDSDQVYVVDTSNHRVQKFTLTGTYVSQFGSQGSGDGEMYYPASLALDESDNIYVTDSSNYRVLKFDNAGNFLAAWGWGVSDGSSTYQVCTSGCQTGDYGDGSGQFKNPRGIAVSSSHLVYVVDSSVNRVQIFDTDGNYQGQFGSQGFGPGQFRGVTNLAIAADDTLFIIDGSGQRVQHFDAAGNYLGQWGSYGSNPGEFSYPVALAFDSFGDFYVLDQSNYRVHKFSPAQSQLDLSMSRNGDPQAFWLNLRGVDPNNGSITWTVSSLPAHGTLVLTPTTSATPTLVYTPTVDYIGPDDFVLQLSNGLLTNTLSVSLTINGRPAVTGTTVITDEAYEIRGMLDVSDPNSEDTLRYTYDYPYPQNGSFNIYSDGEWYFAPYNRTSSYTDSLSVIVYDNDNLTATTTFTFIISADDDPPQFVPGLLRQWGESGSDPGQFNYPWRVVVDETQVYVLEYSNNRVTVFDKQGNYQTHWGSYGTGDGQFRYPRSLALDGNGYVYVADTDNNRVQKFTLTGTYVSQFGSYGADEGQLKSPNGIAIDSSGNIYIGDSSNYRIQKFDSSGNFLEAWGWGVADGSAAFQICTSACQAGSRGPAADQFEYIYSLSIDRNDVLYVTGASHYLQMFDSDGTFLRRFGGEGRGEGQFGDPAQVAVDAAGNIYVADSTYDRIEKFSSAGVYMTQWGNSYSGPDGALDYPHGVAIDDAGLIYVADSENDRIRVYDPNTETITRSLNVESGLAAFNLSLREPDSSVTWSFTTAPLYGTAAFSVSNTHGATLAYTLTEASTLDQVVVQVDDGLSTDVITVNLVLSNVTVFNNPPQAVDDDGTTLEDTALVLDVLANDSDPEGDPLSLSAVSPPSNGTAAIVGSTIVYTPTQGFSGSDSFTYTLSDGDLSDVGTVSISVIPGPVVNTAPQAVDDSDTTDEDTPVSIDVLANDSDPEGDPLSLSAVSPPSNGTAAIAGNSIVYAPPPDFSGSDSFTYTLSDGELSNVATVTVTVTPVNDAPQAANDNGTTVEDTAIVIDVLANDSDPEGDPLSLSAVSPPSNGTAAIAGNSIVYTPPPDFSGSDSFTYTLSDGELSNVATVTVTVTPVNDAPQAISDTVTTAEDQAVLIDVLQNDVDVDGDTLLLLDFDQPIWGQVALVEGRLRYTPLRNFYGFDTFNYTLSDGQGGSDVGTVELVVTPVNDPPRPVDDAAFTAAETLVVVNVLANDRDPDGDPLTLVDLAFSANATVSFSEDGFVYYTPNVGFSGLESLDYTVDDGQGGQATATVSIVVAGQNDQITARDDQATTLEDTAVVLTPLQNDSAASGASLSILGVGAPAFGEVSLSDGQSLVYTPSLNYHGPDSFTYLASDGSNGAVATITLYVDPVNDPPIALDDSGTLPEDGSVELAVLANDGDIDGDTVTLSSLTQPQYGRAFIIYQDGGVVIRYRPTANYFGPDRFTYILSDGNGGTDSAAVRLNVTPVNDVPVLVDDVAETDEDTPIDIFVLDNDGDIETQPLTLTEVSSPQFGTVITQTDGSVRYTPDPNYNGEDSFTYRAVDSQGGLASAEVSLTIHAVDDPPEGVQDATIVLSEGNRPGLRADPEVEIDVLANDVNVDDAELSVARVGRARSGRVSIGDGGKIKYTPDPDFTAGTDVFTYVVGAAGTTFESLDQVSILLNPDPDAVIAAADVVQTNEDTPVTFSIFDNDRNNVPATELQLMGLIPGSKGYLVPNEDQTLTYYPAKNVNGDDFAVYIVGNGENGGDSAAITITIKPVNDPPDAVVDVFTATQAISRNLNVIANDIDVDGDTIDVVEVLPSNNASVSLNPDGSLQYDPNPGFFGLDIFAYVLRDAQGRDDIGLVGISVEAVNQAPIAAPDQAVTVEETPLTLNVLLNDFDEDSAVLTITQVTQGVLGRVALNLDQTLTYTPSLNAVGNDSFAYILSDGERTAQGQVSIRITPSNDPPEAWPDTAAMAMGETRRILVLANDLDPDGDVVSLTAVGAAQNGQTGIDGTALTYTPLPLFSGTDSFTYTLSDGTLGRQGRVTVTVGAANRAPTPVTDLLEAVEDTPISLLPLTNDTDPDGDNMLLTAAGAASHGIVTLANNRITYRPELDFYGSDSFTYTLSDGELAATGQVEVIVSPVGDPPQAVDDWVTAARNRTTQFDVLSNDLDPDGDLGNVAAVGSAQHGQTSLPNPGYPMKFRPVIYTPAADFTGTDVFTYTATDGLYTSVATVTVSVLESGLLLDNQVTAANVNAVALGSVVTYTLSLSNYSELAADGVVLTSTLPQGIVFGQAAPADGVSRPDDRTLVWQPGRILSDALASLQVTAIVTTNPAYGGRSLVNQTEYRSSNAGWGAASSNLTLRGGPALTLTYPVDGQVFYARNGLTTTVPIQVGLSNFTLPTDGHWRLWVNQIDHGPMLSESTSLALPLGTYTITARLESETSQALGSPSSLSFEVRTGRYFGYLPLILR